MSHITLRYEKFCLIHNIQYIRDYIDYFIEWYAKRSKYYIPDQWLIDINVRMRKKYGFDFGRNGSSKPHYLNKQFGLVASGEFCRISHYKLTPMHGTLCGICGTPSYSFVSKIDKENPHNNLLTEYRTKIDNLTNKETLDLVLRTHCIETLSHLENRRTQSHYIGKDYCNSIECQSLVPWLNRTPLIEPNNITTVPLNIPTQETLSKQDINYRKPFIVARYLDFIARHLEKNNAVMEGQK